MDFSYSEKTQALRKQLTDFMDQHIVPRIGAWQQEVAAGVYPVSFMEDLKSKVDKEGVAKSSESTKEEKEKEKVDPASLFK